MVRSSSRSKNKYKPMGLILMGSTGGGGGGGGGEYYRNLAAVF